MRDDTRRQVKRGLVALGLSWIATLTVLFGLILALHFLVGGWR